MRVVLSAILAAAFTTPASASPQSSIRPEGGQLKTLVEHGMSGSPTFRTVSSQLDDSDVLVYVRFGRCGTGVSACMQFVSALTDRRVLLVTLDPFDRSPREIIGLLAHELAHAVEFGADRSARDAAGFRHLFEHQGWKGTYGFETAHAQAIQRIVASELSR